MSAYAVRFVCPCGWYNTPWTGSEFFNRSDYPCCPECGRDASEREEVIAKEVPDPNAKWWQFGRRVLVTQKEG